MEDLTPLKSKSAFASPWGRSVLEGTKTAYEVKAKYIKKYLSNRYENDEDFKTSINKTRTLNNFIKYNTDEEYRNKLLERRKAEYRRKVEIKLTLNASN
jgi:hypothetical protein